MALAWGLGRGWELEGPAEADSGVLEGKGPSVWIAEFGNTVACNRTGDRTVSIKEGHLAGEMPRGDVEGAVGSGERGRG